MYKADFIEFNIKQPTQSRRDYIIAPTFVIGAKDMLMKGGAFYAFWDGSRWSQSKNALFAYIDALGLEFTKEWTKTHQDSNPIYLRASITSNSTIRELESYCKASESTDIVLNTKVAIGNLEDLPREAYATKVLPYTPKDIPTKAFDELTNVLYAKEELDKILWCVGSVLLNKSHEFQKFLYIYGGKGSGKGTIIKIIEMVLEGYVGPIDLMVLTSNSSFATSELDAYPALIDNDTNLMAIPNDTQLLKTVSHEAVVVNKKFRSPYQFTFKGLIIAASNEAYKVRNVDSGITRRALVANPTSDTVKKDRYDILMSNIKYEVPGIAYKAIQTYSDFGSGYYDEYVNFRFIEETNFFHAFVVENEEQLKDGITLSSASALYKDYLEDNGYSTDGYKRKLKFALARYYSEFRDQKKMDGMMLKNYYSGFKSELMSDKPSTPRYANDMPSWLTLEVQDSLLDKLLESQPAQYANPNTGAPAKAWANVSTRLSDIVTPTLHYVKVPNNHIVIDFDIKDEDGNKDLNANLKEASKFPQTYAEVSKSGGGLHLHYNWDGDVDKLSSVYDDDIEIKVYKGNSSLRRLLTLCNDCEVTTISSGLPMKEEVAKMYKDSEGIIWTEKKLRTTIKRNLNKEYHAHTKPSIDFIYEVLRQASSSDLLYDLRDMRNDVLKFAMSSTNNRTYCVKKVNDMVFRTIKEEPSYELLEELPHVTGNDVIPDEDLVFYDVEIFPNLFVVCFKKIGDQEVTKWINPTPEQIESLMQHPLVGFNNRKYDNHMIYGRLMHETTGALYERSKILVSKNGTNGYHKGAVNLSYVDIYDYSSKKQSLKKWEFELGILHDEMELPWDEPVDESLWDRVAEYCGHDVEATIEVFHATQQDYIARILLSKLSGCAINDSTQTQAAKFLFGNDRRPQDKFNYTDLSVDFPGYKFENGVSTYRGEVVGEGGYVYAEPGVYSDVVLADIESMHPHTAIALKYFGPYAQRFEDLVKTRLLVKHKKFDEARKMFDGILAPYLVDESKAKELAYALKIIINIVYGLTSAKWDNPFKHPLNIDNIVAKRGALFMINLKHEVWAHGGKVAHIKTDSIKIPNASKELVDFVIDYGHQYGYNFDIEHVYEKIALVNQSTYIAKYTENDKTEWEATGAQFAVPYVYKKLFSHEELEADDFFILKQVSNGASIKLGDRFVGKIASIYASVSGEEAFRYNKDKDKSDSLNGTKGYLWKEQSEFSGMKDVDMFYYDSLVKDAIETINKVGSSNYIIEDCPEEYKSLLLPF